jgi:hypothetical protein
MSSAKPSDLVRVSRRTGEDYLVNARTRKLTGKVLEVWSKTESMDRLGQRYDEPHAVVRWSDGTIGRWPLSMLEVMT